MPPAQTRPALSRSHEALGKALRLLRQERGMSFEELAAKAKIDLSHLGKIERGQSNLTYRTQQRLVEALAASHTRLGELIDRSLADQDSEGSARQL